MGSESLKTSDRLSVTQSPHATRCVVSEVLDLSVDLIVIVIVVHCHSKISCMSSEHPVSRELLLYRLSKCPRVHTHAFICTHTSVHARIQCSACLLPYAMSLGGSACSLPCNVTQSFVLAGAPRDLLRFPHPSICIWAYKDCVTYCNMEGCVRNFTVIP